MAYRFNGSGDYVQFALAPFSGNTFGAYTMAVFFKCTGTFSGRVMQAFTTSADQFRFQVDFSGNNPRLVSDDGNHVAVASQSLSSTTTYYLVVVTWAGGAATPRFHVHDGTSWVHANAASGDGLNTVISGTDKLKVATRNPASNTIAGDFVCVGVKKSDSSDATVETLTRTGFQSWRDFSFDWLIGFDSSLVSGGALQDQASPGTGDQTAISGTSVVSDPAGWSWVGTTRVSSTRAVAYKIAGYVSATRALAYSIAGRVTATRALQYLVGGGVVSTRTVAYTVSQPVASSTHLAYLVTGSVASIRALRYTIVGVGRVASTRTLYAIVDDGGFEIQGRFCIAFNAAALEWDEAIFTRLDDPDLYPTLIASYQIDRGRQYELDRTDTGRATVSIVDTDGILNPRNPDGPFYGQIRPLLQACINRYNPTTGAWRTRFRGYIEDLTYQFDPSQQVNRLVISLVDQFEILSAIEMQPGRFGSGTSADGQITFGQAGVQARIKGVLDDSGIQPHARVVFSGNVLVQAGTYSAGESPMTVVQEAADGEFPGVSNVFCDRKGRLCFHGRFAKFDPDAVAAGASLGAWDFHRWKAGDGQAVHASITDTAQVRQFGFNRGVAKIINQATATPLGIADAAVAAQLVEDTASSWTYGIRSWSATNLTTHSSAIDDSDKLVETKRFATYYVQNYGQPHDRVLDVAFRSLRPEDPRALALWKLLCEVDISDAVAVTVASPGGGGFEAESYFVEGVHETAQPSGDDHVDDVTMTLDLSPEAYFDSNPWPVT